MLKDIVQWLPVGERALGSVEVILTNKQHGQPFKRREVKTFVEYPLLHSGIAEEGYGYPVAALHTKGQCCPDG